MDRNNVGLVTTLRALEAASEVDLLYADRYLCRAESLLPQVMTRDEYARLRQDRAAMPDLVRAMQQAIADSDWSHVDTLAEDAAARQKRLAAHEVLLQLADAVYGVRVLHAGPTTLALNGLAARHGDTLERERTEIVNRLRFLVASDTEWSGSYGTRAAHASQSRRTASTAMPSRAAASSRE